jgi:integrase
VVDRVSATAPDPYRCFIAVQGILGLRFGEAAALRRKSINVLRRRLTIAQSLAEIGGQLIFGPPKTHAQRTIPIPPDLAVALEAHLDHVPSDPEALLFTSARGKPLRYSRFRPDVWAKTLTAANVPYTGLHVLRHSAAARMIAAGWSPKAVQKALGHASAAFTLTVYGHLFDDDWDALAARLTSTVRGPHADQNDSGASFTSGE